MSTTQLYDCTEAFIIHPLASFVRELGVWVCVSFKTIENFQILGVLGYSVINIDQRPSQ